MYLHKYLRYVEKKCLTQRWRRAKMRSCLCRLFSKYKTMETHHHQQQQFTCVGCGDVILDQYVLRVAPDMEWHASCLRCTDCQQLLDETCTCFVRYGKVYCKPDYMRLINAILYDSQIMSCTI